MQSVLRVGAVAAILGCVAIYGLARAGGLVAVYGILLLGFAVGLAMAKWLDWSLYGRQVESGAQAGAIACVPAAVVALFALLSQDSRTVTSLETASHLGPVNAAGFAHAFAFAGWAGADILSVVFATLFAIGLAALTSIVMGWSKNGRAVRSVNQAYEAARSLRAGAWNPGATTTAPAMQGATAAIPAWQGVHPTSAPHGESGLAWPTAPQVAAAVPPAAPYAPPPPITFPGPGANQPTARAGAIREHAGRRHAVARGHARGAGDVGRRVWRARGRPSWRLFHHECHCAHREE